MEATNEFALLERVFLRVGSADTDEQLQNVISKFLLPVLLKLSSRQEGVRKKVMELLVHVNKRLKSRPLVQLPIEALLTQYQDPAATSFVTNFTIIYIKIGYPRLDPCKQADLLPSLLHGIENKPPLHRDSLFLMMMPALGHVQFPKDPQAARRLFGLDEKPKLTKQLLEFILDFLLLPYGVMEQVAASKPPTVRIRVVTGESSDETSTSTHLGASPPPGLSENSYRRVVGETPMDAEQLQKTKVGIVQFLGSGVFADNLVIVPLLIALADTRHSVVSCADMALKKVIGGVDADDPTVIGKLYSVFLGTTTVNDQRVTESKEMKRSPADAKIKLKLLPYLLKSREAANRFPASIQVVFDCLYGPKTNVKLRSLAVQFVHHMCLYCSESRLTPVGPVLLAGMVKLVSDAKDDPRLRGLAYVAIGKLGHKLPQLVTGDMGLVQTMFDAISTEEQGVRLSIQEGLSVMCSAFKNLDSTGKLMMEALLESCIEKPEPQVRRLAVMYAANVFPPNHIPSRYLLLLAAGDMKEDVYSEAAKTLRTVPTKDTNVTDAKLNGNAFPSFPELVNYISEKAEQRLKSNLKYNIGIHTLPFNPTAYVEILMYMRMSLAHNAGESPNLDSSQEMQDQAPGISKYIRKLWLANPGDKNPVHLYIKIISQLLIAVGGAPAMYCLLEVVAVAPDLLANRFINQLDWIESLMFSMKEEMRENASRLFAVVAAHCLDENSFAQKIIQLTAHVKGKDPEKQHGALLALGYALGIKARSNTSLGPIPYQDAVHAMVDALCLMTPPSLLLAACTALGELGRNGPLVLPDGTVDGNGHSKLTLVKTLTSVASASKYPAKIQERAALAAGYLCVGDPKFPHTLDVLKLLLGSSSEKKEVDTHFVIGDALTFAALGPVCSCARDFWTTSEAEFNSTVIDGGTSDHMSFLLREILTKYVPHSNPHIRQAAGMWLLSILKKNSAHRDVQAQLGNIQNAFLGLLNEANDITQDMASKGVGLVYECSGEEQKLQLVSILVDTLMVGSRDRQKISDDTKVFEEGELGKSVAGGTLSTYKELCSLASDLNQPDLVYKFMNLAHHNAIWNSKKGAAFGFGNIADKAREQLLPYLPRLIPRLYRYRYDPNSKVQNSMNGIWQTLVTDQQKMIDEYFKEILQDLRVNLTSNIWRVRESSCLALADLLKKNQPDILVEELAAIWEICFRVRDDIKESVRLAAEATLKSLAKVSIRMCDVNAGRIGDRAIAEVLPVLLGPGLTSQVIEVRTISLTTVSRIGKNAGILLKPHVPLLVVALLESLSSSERQELSYLSVRLAGSEQGGQELLDNARIASLKASPIMNAINDCLQYVDADVLNELVPKLTDLIRSSVGLGTKAGCAHIITHLTHRCLQDLQPHAGKILSALLAGLHDRSAAIRKNYANAIGNIVKAAKDATVAKLVTRLRSWYMESEVATVRQSCCETLHAMARHSPDVLKEHAAQALPLAFLAMQSPKVSASYNDNNTDQSDETESWEEVWLEITPGTEAGIRLYGDEIAETIGIALGSSSWKLKVQGALAIKTVADKSHHFLSPQKADLYLKLLLDGLSGRIFVGKEHFLTGILAVCANLRHSDSNVFDGSGVGVNEVVDILLKECRKENLKYKMEALNCTSSIVELFDVNRFEDAHFILKPIISEKGQERDFTNDGEKDAGSVLKLEELVFECYGKVWPKDRDTQEKYALQYCEILQQAFNSSTWKVQLAILKTMNKFVDRLYLLQGNLSDDDLILLRNVTNILLKPLCASAVMVKFSAVRTEAMDVMDKLLSKLQGNGHLGVIEPELVTEVVSACDLVSTGVNVELQSKASRVKCMFLTE